MKQTPFVDEFGHLEFPFEPTRDVVFIWPEELPEKIGNIFLAEKFKENYRHSTGIVLAVGSGYFNSKKKKFVPTVLKVKDYVIYDSGIPWSMMVTDKSGVDHLVFYCGERDIQGYIKGSQDE